MVRIRRALPEDVKDFVELILISAHYFSDFFGKNFRKVLEGLFFTHSNLFSIDHVYSAELDGRVAGVILGYDWRSKSREDLRTGFLLLKEMGLDFLKQIPLFIKFNNTVGSLNKGEYYISNVAVYSEYRGLGIGKKLLFQAEEEVKNLGDEKIALDVEANNANAIAIYKRLDYKITEKFTVRFVKGEILQFYRMNKSLSRNS